MYIFSYFLLHSEDGRVAGGNLGPTAGKRAPGGNVRGAQRELRGPADLGGEGLQSRGWRSPTPSSSPGALPCAPPAAPLDVGHSLGKLRPPSHPPRNTSENEGNSHQIFQDHGFPTFQDSGLCYGMCWPTGRGLHHSCECVRQIGLGAYEICAASLGGR